MGAVAPRRPAPVAEAEPGGPRAARPGRGVSAPRVGVSARGQGAGSWRAGHEGVLGSPLLLRASCRRDMGAVCVEGTWTCRAEASAARVPLCSGDGRLGLAAARPGPWVRSVTGSREEVCVAGLPSSCAAGSLGDGGEGQSGPEDPVDRPRNPLRCPGRAWDGAGCLPRHSSRFRKWKPMAVKAPWPEHSGRRGRGSLPVPLWQGQRGPHH